MTLPLTKTMQVADLEQLEPELARVDQWGTEGQTHESRRWEYAMALRAIDTWTRGQRDLSFSLLDVGGAGSNFFYMVPDNVHVQVIDPHGRPSERSWEECRTLAEKVAGRPHLRDIVTCLSVLEHVEDLDQFLYHLACLVAPGGLLFLTMDCCGCDSHDTEPERHHFHWMRKRCFTMSDLYLLDRRFTIRQEFAEYPDFGLLGGDDVVDGDFVYHGDTLYGSYSVCSLALVKRA